MSVWKRLSNQHNARLPGDFATQLQSMYSLSEHDLSTRTCVRLLNSSATKQSLRGMRLRAYAQLWMDRVLATDRYVSERLCRAAKEHAALSGFDTLPQRCVLLF